MLLNPASPNRVQPNRKEKREHEIKKSRPTAKINDGHIVERGTRKIDEEPAIPHRNRLQSWRARQLKKWEEHEPDCLREPPVAHQACFPMVRQVCVVFVITLIGMMLLMINTKANRAGGEIGKIGDDGHHFDPAFVPAK